jgi:hypothetical protein
VATHEYLLETFPFSSLHETLRQMTLGATDGDPREELLDWCCQFGNPTSTGALTSRDAIRRLHGVLHGIAVDGVINRQEVVDLKDWLADYEAFRGVWPFNLVHEMVDRVLADGRVDPEEQQEILDFCLDYGGVVQHDYVLHDAPVNEHAASRAPIYSTLDSVCDSGPVSMSGHTFCFTGQAKTAARAVLHGMVSERGGIPVDRVSRSLDYLVIGGLSNPAWMYAAYGRKIETVIENRKVGATTLIIRERDFLAAL